MPSSSSNNRNIKRISVSRAAAVTPSPKSSNSEKSSRNPAPSRPLSHKLPSELVKTTPFTSLLVINVREIFAHLRRTTKSNPINREQQQVFLTGAEADQIEQCIREHLRKGCLGGDSPKKYLNILTASLQDVFRFTSLYSTGISADKSEDVPIIVWKCIECIMERTSPDALGQDAHGYLLEQEESPRIAELREIFSTGPNFGADHNMDDERLSDVWILFRKFMDGITGVKHIKATSVTDQYGLKPTAAYMRRRQAKAEALAGKKNEIVEPTTPIFPQSIVDRIDDFCISSTVDFTRRTESMVIETAQCYLRLLPLPNLALFRLITAFGTKVYSAMRKAHKGDDRKPLDDVTHVIGAWFFASPKRTIETTDNLMKFFFKNWKKVDKHLYSMAFDSKSFTNKRARLQPVSQAPLWNPTQILPEVRTSPTSHQHRVYREGRPQFENGTASYYEEGLYYEDESELYHEHEGRGFFPPMEDALRGYDDLPRKLAIPTSLDQLEQHRRYTNDALAYIRRLEEQNEFLLDKERYVANSTEPTKYSLRL